MTKAELANRLGKLVGFTRDGVHLAGTLLEIDVTRGGERGYTRVEVADPDGLAPEIFFVPGRLIVPATSR